MNYWQDQLTNKINKLLIGEYSVEEFREAYYWFFVDEVPEDVLSGDECDYFGGIQEKLDWVTENPESDERKYGWINNDEFVKWVAIIVKENDAK